MWISVKCHVLGCVGTILKVKWNAILWWSLHKFEICLFVQHDYRCKHVSFRLRRHKLQWGKMLLLRTFFVSGSYPYVHHNVI